MKKWTEEEEQDCSFITEPPGPQHYAVLHISKSPSKPDHITKILSILHDIHTRHSKNV
ncbi:hypothetical protein HK097_006104, partial [Rhizophlyctis rosea]